jgi:hypothetical protein
MLGVIKPSSKLIQRIHSVLIWDGLTDRSPVPHGSGEEWPQSETIVGGKVRKKRKLKPYDRTDRERLQVSLATVNLVF